MIELWRVMRMWSWWAMGLAVLSLVLLGAGVESWNILTPFAAVLTLVAGPFGVAMARAARLHPKGPAQIMKHDAVGIFALAALLAGGESLASWIFWDTPGLLFKPAAATACVLGLAGLIGSYMAKRKLTPLS